MSDAGIGVAGLLVLFALIMIRLPVAIGLMLVGVGGYALVDGWKVATIVAGEVPYELAAGYSLSVVPLFVLMGAVAARSNMAQELFDSAHALFSGRRGGLAMATVGACAAFGSICGSSLATAATMTRVSVPEMLRHGYARTLSTGSVIAGGTLGILIPPSVILVIYAVIAEQSVAALFAAALIPGILLALLQVVVVSGWTRLDPSIAPESERLPWGQRLAALGGAWKLLLLFALSVGGIYLGLFSPTEAAAVGAFGAIVIAVATRSIDMEGMISAFVETVTTTAMLFFIILGATLFGRFIVLTQIPAALTGWVEGLALSPVLVIVVMVAFYFLLGCFLESISMMLITVPVFLPLAIAMGFDPVWFGVLVVIVVEVGLMTPPVGMNIFVVRAQMPEIPLQALYAGILPFLLANLALIAILLAIPEIALWLPDLFY